MLMIQIQRLLLPTCAEAISENSGAGQVIPAAAASDSADVGSAA